MELAVQWAWLLAAVCAVVCCCEAAAWRRAMSQSGKVSRLLRRYLVVHVLAVGSDWCQGAHIYALYESYGYSPRAIGYLFVVGYVSSFLSGLVVGAIADRRGRRRACLLYSLFYIVGSLTKHSDRLLWLALGRVCTGIATSILTTCFESWLVNEFHTLNEDLTSLQLILQAANLSNGAVSILVSIACHRLVTSFGLVAPFDLSIVLLVLTFVAVRFLWTENYGNVFRMSIFSVVREATALILSRPAVLALGVIQSCFESTIFIFVFFWSPVLEQTHEELPHGIVFTCFMISLMLGSLSAKWFLPIRCLAARFPWLFLLPCLLFCVTITTRVYSVQLACFCFFEFFVGCYYPSLGTIRSQLIPEGKRTTIMNLYRLGVNATVAYALSLHSGTTTELLYLCIILQAVAFFLSLHMRDEFDPRRPLALP